MDEILVKVTEYLDETNIAFKVIRSMALYQLTSQKSFPREMYGKFITIYPDSEKSFKKIIKGLYKILRKYRGPRILSDKRYKDCLVLYYRYGGINPICKIDTLGHKKTYIKDGKGNLIEDIRNPYYDLVPFIKDPFRPEKFTRSRLLKEYDVTDVVDFRNSGGIYAACCKKNGKKVIIKEARPYTVLINKEDDAISLRQREVESLKILGKTGYVPELLDYYYDSEHFFLIEEYIEGRTFYEYVMFENVILRKGKASQIISYFIDLVEIFKCIVQFLEEVECHDMIMTDLSIDNIIIMDNGGIKIIDMEGCAKKEDKCLVTVDAPLK